MGNHGVSIPICKTVNNVRQLLTFSFYIRASILIAYLTPTVGLGCRSASYLLYGCAATISWFCLLVAMLLSHQAMLIYRKSVAVPANDDNPAVERTPARPGRQIGSHRFICYTAIAFRLFGKLVAVLNAGWLIASSLMEFTGAYDTCWCKGNFVGLGHRGWVVIFKDAADLATAAQVPWSSGLALTLIVCLGVSIFFYFAIRRNDDD